MIFKCSLSLVVATGNTSFVQLSVRPVVKGKFLNPSNLEKKKKIILNGLIIFIFAKTAILQ